MNKLITIQTLYIIAHLKFMGPGPGHRLQPLSWGRFETT